MGIFTNRNPKIEQLESEIRALKSDLDRLNDRFMSLKGYVYNKKIHLDEEKPLETKEKESSWYGAIPI